MIFSYIINFIAFSTYICKISTTVWSSANCYFLLLIQAVIKKKYGQDATNVGDEGGFAPNIQVNFS